MSSITIGIDASNIRQGGGVTHLYHFLMNVSNQSDCAKIYVWCGVELYNKLINIPNIELCHESMLDKPLYSRLFWQAFYLKSLAEKKKCDIVFVPGGLYLSGFRPYVVMLQNLLPLMKIEMNRYGNFTYMKLRLILLRWGQLNAFRNSSGLIFLSDFSIEVLKLNDPNMLLTKKYKTIRHGVGQHFFNKPKKAKIISDYNSRIPFRLLYISTIDVYKHQDTIAAAVDILRRKGYCLRLDLVGPAYKPKLVQLRKLITILDPKNEFIYLQNEVSYEDIVKIYLKTDMFLFASTCESFGMIPLEAMAAGIPVLSTNKLPMTEILNNAAGYFDPLNIDNIVQVIAYYLDNASERDKLANAGFRHAAKYKWEDCTRSTLEFIETCIAS